ncbi:hypothetical protein BDV25DRAFT_141356 [Aspergillus avenaceus]|uniref:Cysteine-rich transmembrane CYSTM domain-containing protein n=1 Tax=Aspergillus avenaceus TaxID=36643 RepID=A0A5N6TRG5_ASPAV|nr:hypothetical protein BDV25DRAFT_141356 [Aspergillus avenaceus]
MGFFSWFTSKGEETPQNTWDADTLTMTRPVSPAAPSTEAVVSEQPNEDMQLKLRGGGPPDDDCCCCFDCLCCCGDGGPGFDGPGEGPGGPGGPGGPPGGGGPGGPGGW